MFPTSKAAEVEPWSELRDGGRLYLVTHQHDGDIVVPRTIGGRYEIQAPLAFGADASLYHALDVRTRGPVVVKAVRRHADPVDFAEEVRRSRHLLQTERRLIVRMRNAGASAVVQPLDYVYDELPGLADEPYLILENIDGEPLDHLLATTYPQGMQEVQAISLILPIVRALAVLHEPWRHANGQIWHCVYQDLKPSNVLIDAWYQSRLIDFGGCQVVIDGVPVLEGASTPGYAAPECESPGRVLLACADVYGVGATLRHMLTGNATTAPFEPRELDGRVSNRLIDVMARCLAPRPSDRIADARRLLERLTESEAAMNLAPSP